MDDRNFFTAPVSLDIAPDYTAVISEPMDFGTMRAKLKEGCYVCLDDVTTDFNLIISNCCIYNAKDTVYYKAAMKLSDLVSIPAEIADRCALFEGEFQIVIKVGLLERYQSFMIVTL